MRIKERFETILGFQKPSLTSSTTSEEMEKAVTDVPEKEEDPDKSDKTKQNENEKPTTLDIVVCK